MTRRPGRRNDELAVGRFARVDLGRSRRTGVPEIILGEGKSVEHLLDILRRLHSRGIGALVSRPTAAQRRGLARARGAGLPVQLLAHGRLARLSGRFPRAGRSGTVVLLTAGTSDVPAAEEAREVLHTLSASTLTVHDVGVAGLHRLRRALARTERRRPALYLVFAGREGALPTVVAGLVRSPVLGVPTSVGYGRGGRGEAALGAMLQSCAPVAVVNIDGAVPAALFAAQLLHARHRGRTLGF